MPEVHFVEGLREAIQKGDFAQAIGLIQQQLRKTPEDTELSLELIRLFLRVGDLEPAKALLARLHTKAADHPQYVALLGMSAQLQDQAPEAMLRYEEALALQPSLLWARANLASLLVEAGRYDEAQPHLQQLLEQEPSYYPARFHQIRSALAAGEPQEARKILIDLLRQQPLLVQPYVLLAEFLVREQNGEKAIELLLMGLQINPLAHPLRESLARLYTVMSDPEAAFGIRLELSRLRGLSTDFLELGLAALRKGAPPLALVAFTKAHKLDPQDWRPLYNLAEIFRTSDRMGQAMSHYERAASIVRDERILNGWALCFLEREDAKEADFQQAERLLEEALALSPQRYEARLNLALALSQQKRYPDALKALEPLLSLEDSPLQERVTALHQELLDLCK
ncbi:MAG: tetratricopeptide repeat protein [Myxococcales bacterium]|nr:tetratricopeptide repeat protein [Myxococcales bacterium]